MELRNMSYRIKILAGFATVLLLFVVGTGISIIAMQDISSMMELSNAANQLVKEMFQARAHETDYYLYKQENSVENLNRSILNLGQLISDIKSETGDKVMFSGLDEIDNRVQEYSHKFKKTAENTRKIEDLKKKMRKASAVIFETYEKKIRTPILEAQNMALVTGDAANPVLDELLKVMNPLVIDLKDARSYENGFYMYNEPGYVEKFDEKLKAWKNSEEDLVFLMETAADKNVEAAYAVIKRQFGIYNSDTFKDIFSLSKTNAKLSEDMQSNGEKISEIVQLLQKSTEIEMVKTKNASIKLCAVLLGAGVVFGIVLTFFLSGSITRPIHRIIERLKVSGEELTLVSEQVSSNSRCLVDGSSDQASSIEETSSSIEEISSQAKLSAENGSQADSLMKEAIHAVEDAKEAMNDLAASMEDIAEASDETSQIIKTIDEIAFQTNLLALNAAVEAARAGDVGSGFAVVADEVRNLALRSAKSAKNIAALIESTVGKIQDGSELMAKTKETFAKMAGNSQKVGELLEEVATASFQQAQGIEHISTAVADIDKVTQQNVANAEETESASVEMNAQAEQMKSIVKDLVSLLEGSGNRLIRPQPDGMPGPQPAFESLSRNPGANPGVVLGVGPSRNPGSRTTPSDLPCG